MKLCPQCDQEMQYQPYEPDVGIMMGGWFCTECDVFVEDEDIPGVMKIDNKCSPECPGDQTCEETKYCMCGSRIEDHDIGSGHAPVSMHDYFSQEKNRITGVERS